MQYAYSRPNSIITRSQLYDPDIFNQPSTMAVLVREIHVAIKYDI